MKKRILSLEEFVNESSKVDYHLDFEKETIEAQLKKWENEKAYNSNRTRIEPGSWTINDDLTVDVDGHVQLGVSNFRRLPINFGKVNGEFNIGWCKNLTSLEGCPYYVEEEFTCQSSPKLTSLEGAPKEAGDFSCSDCDELTSLEGSPEIVKGDFSCGDCFKLASLRGAPKKVGGQFGTWTCSSLTSLKYAPAEVGGNFIAENCRGQFTKYDVKTNSRVKGKIYV